MQPNHSFHQVVLRNTPHLCILHDKEVQMISFITAVEINVHNFHLHLTRGQRTKQHTKKQTQWHMHTPTYPRRHNVNLVPCLAGPNC